MIYFAIRDFIGIASSIIFSIRGKRFRELIDELRTIFVELKGSQKNFKALKLVMILIYIFVFLIVTFFVVKNIRKNLNPFIIIIEIIGHFYICLLFLSTDIFLVYFINYLAIIQKSFENLLIDYQKISLNFNNIQEIKSKFVRIQLIIEKISVILSPLLLFNCGAIFYNIVSNLYFTVKSIENSVYYEENSMARNFAILFYSIRLLFYCLSAERIKSQVLFSHKKL
jgi:hypothetical protein